MRELDDSMPNPGRFPGRISLLVAFGPSTGVRRAAGLEMRVIDRRPLHEGQADLLGEWNRLRRTGLPSRRDLSPTRLAPIARHLYICDLREGSPPDYRFRYVGTDLVELYGDPTGRLLSEFAGTPWAERVAAANAYTVEAQEPVAVVADRIAAAERGHLSSDTLCLPLSDDGVTVSAVMTVMHVRFRDGG